MGRAWQPCPTPAADRPHDAPRWVHRLDRGAGGLRVSTRGAVAGVASLLNRQLFSGALETIGAIATITAPPPSHPDTSSRTHGPLHLRAEQMAVSDQRHRGKLVIRVTPLAGTTRIRRPSWSCSTGRTQPPGSTAGVDGAPAEGVVILVADDGSTGSCPPRPTRSPSSTMPPREGRRWQKPVRGKVLHPGSGRCKQRRPVSLDLCDCTRGSLLHPDEIGIDSRSAASPSPPATRPSAA